MGRYSLSARCNLEQLIITIAHCWCVDPGWSLISSMLLWALSSEWMLEVFLRFGFSWLDTIKAMSLQSHSNMEWTDKRDWRKSGPQQNPACPSANLLSHKHSSHFLPLSLEPLAPRWSTNSAGCSTGVVTCAISNLFHIVVNCMLSQVFHCVNTVVCAYTFFFFQPMVTIQIQEYIYISSGIYMYILY